MSFLKRMRATSVERSKKWHLNGAIHWNPMEWACAMAGEAGEVCDAAKKLARLDSGMVQNNGPASREQAIQDVADEIADTILYLDLLAAELGIDLEEAVRHKFNKVSERNNFEERL